MKVTIIHNRIAIYQQVTFSIEIINEETATEPAALASKIRLINFGLMFYSCFLTKQNEKKK